jgi:protein SCO1/2
MVALMLGALGYFVLAGRAADAFATCRTAGGPGGIARLGGDYTLVDQSGRRVTQDDVAARPGLLYFGYSFCPDVCPLDLHRNAVAVDILSENSHDVAPIFVSLDPGRDTPAHLSDFARNLHPAMIAMTGTPDEVRAAAAAFRVSYDIHEPGADGHYLIDHTTLTYLVMPGHGVVEAFGRALGPDDVAERVACFLGTT